MSPRSTRESVAALTPISSATIRCPRTPGERLAGQLARFNDHLAKGLYARACGMRRGTLAELQEYVDNHREEFYLDGPNDVDWIFRNEVLEGREGALYVDYVGRPHQLSAGAGAGGALHRRRGGRQAGNRARALEMIEHRIDEWDVSGIITRYADRIIATDNRTDYYRIVTVLAQMRRDELKEFKTRFALSLQKARANEFTLPYRVAFPRLDCGFVFVPLTDDVISHRRTALLNFTMAHKYDQRLQRCIGLTFAPDGDEHYTVEWSLMDYPWECDEEIEQRLADNNPFREVRSVRSERYSRRQRQE